MLLDKRICPSVENLTPVISSVCAFSTWISGLLPHPVFMVQSYKRHIIQAIKRINQTVWTNKKRWGNYRNFAIYDVPEWNHPPPHQQYACLHDPMHMK
jgi:hypothetical protein